MYLRRSLLEEGVLCCPVCGHREKEPTGAVSDAPPASPPAPTV